MRLFYRVLLLGSYWLGHLCTGYAQNTSNTANTSSTYPIDWSSVSAAPSAATDLGASSCICALLGSTCTPNCCCDPACPASAVADMRAAGSCLPEGPPPEQLAYCAPDEPFAKVNLPAGDFYRIQKAPAGADFITQLLCITADNNPSLGLRYPDPPAGDVGINAQQAACPAATATAAASTTGSYSFEQPIIVSAPSTAAGGRVRGPFTLPVAALSAECLDLQQVGMLSRVPPSLKESVSSCQRTISSSATLTALCNDTNSTLSPTYYSGLQFPANPASTALKAINVSALSAVNSSTGGVTSLDPVADLAAPVSAAGPPVGCAGVVLEAHFLFRHSTASSNTNGTSTKGLQLSSSQVELVIGDVAMPAVGALVLEQRFSVRWANTTATEAVLLPFSGAPGYLPGFPVLAGLAESATAADGSTQKAVARLTAGLTLPGAAAGGLCSGSTDDAVSLTFGYNASSSCSIGFTRAQLKAYCTANDPTQTLTSLMGGWLTQLTSEQVVLGIWGNADPTNINQWVTLKSSSWPPTANLEWVESTSTCNNIITGFGLNILTGVAWAEGNLQSKVLYGQLCFTYGSWTYNDMTAPGLQSFQLQFTAGFTPKEQQQATLAMKPAPPLAVPLPPDLFYPFMTSGVAGSHMAGLQVLVTLAIALLVAGFASSCSAACI